jgi:hypothetical protein
MQTYNPIVNTIPTNIYIKTRLESLTHLADTHAVVQLVVLDLRRSGRAGQLLKAHRWSGKSGKLKDRNRSTYNKLVLMDHVIKTTGT